MTWFFATWYMSQLGGGIVKWDEVSFLGTLGVGFGGQL